MPLLQKLLSTNKPISTQPASRISKESYYITKKIQTLYFNYNLYTLATILKIHAQKMQKLEGFS